jgi:hypothetical protein
MNSDIKNTNKKTPIIDVIIRNRESIKEFRNIKSDSLIKYLSRKNNKIEEIFRTEINKIIKFLGLKKFS